MGDRATAQRRRRIRTNSNIFGGERAPRGQKLAVSIFIGFIIAAFIYLDIGVHRTWSHNYLLYAVAGLLALQIMVTWLDVANRYIYYGPAATALLCVFLFLALQVIRKLGEVMEA